MDNIFSKIIQYENILFGTTKILPYTSNISKNKKFAFRRSKVKSKGYADFQRSVAIAFKSFCKQLEKRKVWIIIFVYRPNMRADPTNFIEGICDGVKVVCPNVDDNYFSCICDWFLDKTNPRFEITIIQEKE